MDRLIELIREEFEKEVGVKTGWGKNEVMTCFDKACIRAITKFAREKAISLD